MSKSQATHIAKPASRSNKPAGPQGSIDVGSLRAREFPWMLTGDEVFLNAASTGPLPQRAIDAVIEWTRLRATPHRMPDHLLFGMLARARELVARLIGASPEEIALAVNTGYGINLAA